MVDLKTKEEKNTWASNVIISCYLRGITPDNLTKDGTAFMDKLRIDLGFESIEKMFNHYIALRELIDWDNYEA